MPRLIRYAPALAAVLMLAGPPPAAAQSPETASLTPEAARERTLTNETAYIPPQCYTKTEGAAGDTHNPCYVCHTPSSPPNFVNDGDQQLSFGFPGFAEVNHWVNLFADRSTEIATQTDAEILAYVRADNYRTAEGRIPLAEKLADPAAGWDYDGDGSWSGYVPDAYFDFDERGYDRAPDGRATGWRVFAYYPFPGTFWPTNGSTDDVLIRLPEAFRSDETGKPDPRIYEINLAIVEAVIRARDIAIDATDETVLGVDLDKDGSLSTAHQVTFDWAPLEGRTMSYVGAARRAQQEGELHLARGLFPEGTEFLHSVRYIDVAEDGRVGMAARMKELRYARKLHWVTYADLEEAAMHELKEGDDFPNRPRTIRGNAEIGVANGMGWVFQGFIEDRVGDLRPQTYEENVFCVGCHSGVGVTTDAVFSFPRRFAKGSFRDGWYHWSDKGFAGVAEPKRADGRYEFTHYLERNGAGDEFRSNTEVIAKFFDAESNLKPEMAEALHGDISLLLLPSAERTLALNKAYRAIVREQSFVLGRDAILSPPENVHEEVEEDQPTGIEAIVSAF